MENASRALIIAGTVLISVVVLIALIFAFRDIRGLKEGETKDDEYKKIADFNKSFESYDKDLYGSELLSLANKIADYNVQYTEETGYEKITLSVKEKSGTYDQKHYVDVQDNMQKLMQTYKNTSYIEALHDAFDTKSKINNKNDAQYQKAEQQIKDILNKIGKKESEIKSNINKDFETYTQYSSLKNKKFKPTANSITYYKNGRIKEMNFEE